MRTHLSGVEVGASQQVLQVDVSLRLGLFQHDHRVGLSEKRTSRSQLSQLDQLQHNLVREQPHKTVSNFNVKTGQRVGMSRLSVIKNAEINLS